MTHWFSRLNGWKRIDGTPRVIIWTKNTILHCKTFKPFFIWRKKGLVNLPQIVLNLFRVLSSSKGAIGCEEWDFWLGRSKSFSRLVLLWRHEILDTLFKTIFCCCGFPIILPLFFRYIIGLVFRWYRDSNSRPRTMAWNTNPRRSQPDQGGLIWIMFYFQRQP